MKRLLMGVMLCATVIGFAGTSMAYDGAAIYKSKCMACHGAGGSGTSMGPAFKGSDYINSSSVEDITGVILKGRTGAAKKYKKLVLGMPAQKLGGPEVEALVEHLKVLASK